MLNCIKRFRKIKKFKQIIRYLFSCCCLFYSACCHHYRNWFTSFLITLHLSLFGV